MNGYSSRLIEQSGISVEPTVDPTSAVPVQPPNRSEERDMMASTHAERDEPIEETQKGSEVDSGPIVVEVVQKRLLHGEVSEIPRRQRELDPRDSERTSPRREGAVGVLLEEGYVVEGDPGAGWPGTSRRGTLERGEAIEGAAFRAEERSSPGVEATGKAFTFEPGAEQQDRISLERGWQNALKEVREWVTGSPMADDEDAENRDVRRARGTTDSPFVEERGAAPHPKPTAPSPREEPEAQDLRLEIGTISVTVEEPQKELPESDRRTKTAEKKSASNSERSRLSRHYLRVR